MLKGMLAALCLAIAFFGSGISQTQNKSQQASMRSTKALRLRDRKSIATKPQSSVYRINAAQSSFVAHVDSAGLLWFAGHSHSLAVRDFSGTAELNPESLETSSLRLTIKTESLQESDPKFTDQEKKIITGEVKDQVLEAGKYPEIAFNSQQVSGKKVGDKYELQIAGQLNLHGVTRQIVIPTEVSADGRNLRATGRFSIDRTDYNVKATSVKSGMVRASAKVTFTFDIVAER